MPDHVVERLLHDAEGADACRIVQRLLRPGGFHLDLQWGAFFDPGRIPPQCGCQAQVVQVGGAQVAHQPLQLPKGFGRERLKLVKRVRRALQDRCPPAIPGP